LLGNRQSVW